MSKQDRQGVRTPADLERKYDFGQYSDQESSAKKQGDQINRITQTLAQFMSSTNATLETMEDKGKELESDIEVLEGQDYYQSIMIDASGTFIRLYDSSPLAPKEFKIYGKTMQYGTPIPAVPVELVSLCKYDGIDVTIGASEIDESPQRLMLPVLNGFPGIPVSEGGDYTDGSGQQWIADYIDLVRGVYVQRIGAIASYNGEEIGAQFISNTGELTAEATVQYVLPEPIETVLTEEEFPSLAEVHTYKPRTVIYNDAEAWQTVRYVADTKTYVDNTSEAEAAAGRVRYDTIQTLEDTEREQARYNIGAASQIEVTMLSDRVDALAEDVGEGGGETGGTDIEFPISIENGGTGATTAEEARANLGAAAAGCTIVQTAGTNLDDYTTDGLYFFSTANAPVDIPVGSNGWLQVVTIPSGSYVKQIWYRAGTPGSNDYHIWVRTYGGTTGWGNWYQIDTIVEEKTSGIWTYRKYASGIAECWGQETVTVDITTDFGGWFRANITPTDYPFEFAALPTAHLDATSTNNRIFVLAKYGEPSVTNIGTFAVMRPTSSSGAGIRAYYRAVGRWK